MENKLNLILYYLLVGIMLFTLLSVPIVMVTYSRLYPEEFHFSEIPYVLLGMLYCAGVFICYKRYFRPDYIRWLVPLTFVIMNVVAILFVCFAPTVPVSDHLIIWDVAKSIADGKFEMSQYAYYDYIYIYNYQVGISWFESLSIRIFGPTFLPLQIFNIFLLNAMAALLWALCRRFLTRAGSALAIFILATFYPVLVTVPQFTNQHIACVIILGVILLLSSKKIYKWAIAGLLVATLNILRPMGIILLLTAVVCILAVILTRRGRALSQILSLLCFIAVYSIAMGSVNYVFERAGYADGPISSSKMTWFKFHKGLTGYDCPTVGEFGSLEEFNQWEKDEVIHAVTDDLASTATYVAGKMIRYLGCFDYKVEMTYNHDKEIWSQPHVKRLIDFGWGQYLAVVFFAMWCLVKKRKDIDLIQPPFIFYIGITLVYVFIEAFSSYRYESYPYLILMSCLLYSCRTRDRQKAGRIFILSSDKTT